MYILEIEKKIKNSLTIFLLSSISSSSKSSSSNSSSQSNASSIGLARTKNEQIIIINIISISLHFCHKIN